jgi:ADP-ribosylglycohydrolase
MIINANSCGDNVSRGALLGAIFGAAYGFDSIPKWAIDGLS